MIPRATQTRHEGWLKYPKSGYVGRERLNSEVPSS